MKTDFTQSSSYGLIYHINHPTHIRRIMLFILLMLVAFMFVPWTQNIKTKGYVTSLRQEQRTQNVNTVLSGRIAKWFIQEGQLVKAGDTIAQLSEIKDDYLDPELLNRTQEQVLSKELSVDYYKAKSTTSEQQMEALQNSLSIKTDQLRKKLNQLSFKLKSDSASLLSAKNDFLIATNQFDRQQALYEKGLVSLTQLEQRNASLQGALSKKESAQNTYTNTVQEMQIVQLEMKAAIQENIDKYKKAEGDKLQALSQMQGSEGEKAKLKNQYANYAQRQKLFFIIAPQDGQIVQAKRSGIGEVVKEGETIVQIVPNQIDLGVELFISPFDVTLIQPGLKIRFVFDGFPAIVFSGWPSTSYGTFGGIVSSIEKNVSSNGKYRVLVRQDINDRPWPKNLLPGAGTQAIALLKDVPIWYELWRNINGFPADFYTTAKNNENSVKK